MPYNKGDFTQQGIAGYVNGGLLLNNKRDVTTRISTDEESAGIDSVDIKIKDRLNDIEYHITGENLTEGENVIGGGGGVEIENPILTINYKENGYNLPHTIGQIFEEMPPLCAIENNFITISPSITGETGILQLYILDMTDDFLLIFRSTVSNISASNEDNSKLLENQGMYAISVTDPTQNASITIEYTLGSN